MDVLQKIAERNRRLGINPPFKTGRGLPLDVRASFSVDGAAMTETTTFGDRVEVDKARKSDEENLKIRKKLDRIEAAVGIDEYKSFSSRIFSNRSHTRTNIIAVINITERLLALGQRELVPLVLDILDDEKFSIAEVPNDEEKELCYQRQAALWSGEGLEEIEAELATFRAKHEKKGQPYFSNIILLKIEALTSEIDPDLISTKAFSTWLEKWVSPSKQGENFESIEAQMALINEQTVKILMLNNWLSLLSAEERRNLNINEVFELVEHSRVSVDDLEGELKRKMTLVVSDKFLPGDDNDFEEHFLNRPGNRVQFFTCGGELIAFFGEELISEDLELLYLDWFNLARNSVRGVSAQACMKAGVGSLIASGKSLVCVAKPHVASFKTAIEDLGFVGAGITSEENYKHRYINCRNLKTENPESYRLKQLTQTESATLANKCLVLEPGLHDVEMSTEDEDLEIQVLVLDLSGYSDQDDLEPDLLDQIEALPDSVITRVFQKGKKYALAYERSKLPAEVVGILSKAKEDFYDQRGY